MKNSNGNNEKNVTTYKVANDSMNCPSATCSVGSLLIGIVTKNGSVEFLPQPLVIDKEFVSTALRGRTPGKRFRFSSKCVQNNCKQWKNQQCGVADLTIKFFGPIDKTNGIPDCAIRSKCQWFRQAGTEVCSVCRKVITEILN